MRAHTVAGALSAGVLMLFHTWQAHCLTLVRHPQTVNEIQAKEKFPLKPLEITCELGDFIIISAPIIVKPSRTIYHLHKPNGDVVELNNIQPPGSPKHGAESYDAVIEEKVKVKYYRNLRPVMTVPSRYEVFNVNIGGPENSPEKLKDIGPHEFLLGPVTSEHNGNWVLSLYYKQEPQLHHWTELFQVISIEVIEYIRASPFLVTLTPGKTFVLKFPHHLDNLESCELIAPKTTIDRFYSRNDIGFQYCRYIVRNVTKADEGLWTIRAAGEINYITKVLLQVKPKKRHTKPRRLRTNSTVGQRVNSKDSQSDGNWTRP